MGSFADVMLALPGGHRVLLAPSAEVAEYIAATYTFDEVRIVDVDAIRTPGLLAVRAGGLVIDVAIGGRTLLGGALWAVPRPIGRSTRWAQLIDPVARRVVRGVRTTGTAGNGRREWYGATDLHRVTRVTASLDGTDLGALADVWPPVGFGFASTPRTPSICAVTTTVELPT